jgi:hypothetical protein
MRSEKALHKYVPSVFLILSAIIFVIPSQSQAQLSAELTPYYGYLLSTNVRISEGDLVVKDSPLWGVTLDLGHKGIPGAKLQLMYNRQSTKMELKEYPSKQRKYLFDVDVDYWQLGIVREVPLGSKKIVPYGVVGLGAANFTPDNPAYGNEWFFAGHFGGGIKAFFSDNIGLRLQARALLPFSFASGGLWCGTGGCNIGMGSYSSIIQFDFTAGLVIAIGRK